MRVNIPTLLLARDLLLLQLAAQLFLGRDALLFFALQALLLLPLALLARLAFAVLAATSLHLVLELLLCAPLAPLELGLPLRLDVASDRFVRGEQATEA